MNFVYLKKEGNMLTIVSMFLDEGGQEQYDDFVEFNPPTDGLNGSLLVTVKLKIGGSLSRSGKNFTLILDEHKQGRISLKHNHAEEENIEGVISVTFEPFMQNAFLAAKILNEGRSPILVAGSSLTLVLKEKSYW